MGADKALHPTPAFLLELKEEGRNRAEAWLERNGASVGQRSSVDLNAFV
jgi:NTE family protein